MVRKFLVRSVLASTALLFAGFAQAQDKPNILVIVV